MAELELDALFAVAEAGPTLDKVVVAVPTLTARRLEKLQEDVGLEIDHEMTGAPLTGPGEGPDSARLRAGYEPVTRERLGVFHECLGLLPAGDLRNEVAEIARKLPLPETTTAPAAAPKHK